MEQKVLVHLHRLLQILRLRYMTYMKTLLNAAGRDQRDSVCILIRKHIFQRDMVKK